MKIGDIVMRKDIWGLWKKYNPWMYEKKRQLGIIVGILDTKMVRVLWADATTTYTDKKLLELVPLESETDKNCP